MSRTTAIQWCDSTINPVMGCEGCELWNAQHKSCYAGILHRRFGGRSKGYAPTFEKVTQFPGRMKQATKWSDLAGTTRPDKPWLNGLPRIIFVSDMSDALSSVVPFEYLYDEIIVNVTISAGRRHRWLWLTKRPGRMAEFGEWLTRRGCQWPPNLWIGTSVTTQSTTSRIGKLLRVGGATTIRFVSVEPQSEPIDLCEWLPYLHWVIQGGESGDRPRRFDIAWAYDVMSQCNKCRVPYFLKQLGTNVAKRAQALRFNDSHGGDWSEWPEDLCVREMPVLNHLMTSRSRP